MCRIPIRQKSERREGKGTKNGEVRGWISIRDGGYDVWMVWIIGGRLVGEMGGGETVKGIWGLD